MMEATAERRIFFFHNPKAGGTAIRHALAKMFAPPDICPLIENSQRDHERCAGQYDSFRGYGYYGGHYGYDIFQAVDDNHAPVTNFRHPVGRLVSLYNYYRFRVDVPDDPRLRDELYPVVLAQRADFREFVTTDDPRIEIHTRNHHARQLTNSAWTLGSRGDLARAQALVGRMQWFYVCEQRELSMQWARLVFGDGLPAIGCENVTDAAGPACAREAAIDAKTLRIILAKNELDLELYRYAEMRLRQACGAGA